MATNTTTQHTPGPWTVDHWEIGERKEPQTVVRTDSDCIAYVKYLWCNPDLRLEEAEANARLIAAAPEMLGALHAFMGAWDGAKSLLDLSERIPAIRAAIAKATGGGQ